MSLTLTFPAHYGYVVIGNLLGTFATSMHLGGMVMTARKEYKVEYPNLYATPKYHEKADEFNRVQRGHQSMLESSTVAILASLIGGLK